MEASALPSLPPVSIGRFENATQTQPTTPTIPMHGAMRVFQTGALSLCLLKKTSVAELAIARTTMYPRVPKVAPHT